MPTQKYPTARRSRLLPDLGALLRADLRKVGERALAEQIADLRIYGRCCDASPCGTFFCLSKEERRNLYRKRLAHTVRDLIVAQGRIAEVITCSADVDTVLRQIFPEPEGLDGPHGR